MNKIKFLKFLYDNTYNGILNWEIFPDFENSIKTKASCIDGSGEYCHVKIKNNNIFIDVNGQTETITIYNYEDDCIKIKNNLLNFVINKQNDKEELFLEKAVNLFKKNYNI